MPALPTIKSPWKAWLLITLALFHFSFSYVRSTEKFLKLETYLAYRDGLPYQARVLVAWVYNLINTRITLPSMSFGASVPPGATLFFLGLAFISSLTSVYCLRRILSRQYQLRQASIEIATVALFACMYFEYVTGYEFKFLLPYDLSALALWSIFILCMYENQLILGLIAFALATVNRETSLLLIPCGYIILRFHAKRSNTIQFIYAIALSATWLACKLWLSALFHNNPIEEGNGFFVVQIWKNLRHLANPLHWPQISSVWGFIWLPLVWGWSKLVNPTNRGFIFPFAMMLAIMLSVGLMIETRIFGEMGFIAVLCFAELMDIELRAAYK